MARRGAARRADSWYEDAVAHVAEHCPAFLRLTHRFQTNGVLLREDWARCFPGGAVGLSIDGPADLHDNNRRTHRGQGTHAKAMRAVRVLQDQGLAFHVITVLTERALKEPERLFDFYVQNGITDVGFNIEEIEGVNTRSSLAGANVETRYRAFVERFFELVWNAPGLLKVREFESALAHLLSDQPVRDKQNAPFAIVSISQTARSRHFPRSFSAPVMPASAGFVRPRRQAQTRGYRAQRAVRSHRQRNTARCRRLRTYVPVFSLVRRGSPGKQAVRDRAI